MDAVLKALTAWREANEKAKLAESALAEALRLEMSGGPVVDLSVLHEVARLRAIADHKLSASIQAMTDDPDPKEARLQ
ncbi:hypothetical protein [Ramlibacter sp. PS4R-6]|uniref:hypothetical protein n=1 Tax=Ramlibacter sp. PS4R-6 TaxID=3133438 RepID=UPI0030A90CFF